MVSAKRLNFCDGIRAMAFYNQTWSYRAVDYWKQKTKEYVKFLALKVVAVAYERIMDNLLIIICLQVLIMDLDRCILLWLPCMLEAKNNWYLNIYYGLINNVLFLDLYAVDHSILLKNLQLLRDQIIPLRSLPEYFCQWDPIRLSSYQLWGPTKFCTWTLIISHLYKWPTKIRAIVSCTFVCWWYLAHSFRLWPQNYWRKVKDLNQVQKWLQSNKLTLNVKKTKYITIGSHYRLRHLNGHLNATVGGPQLTRATNYRYLGIEVEDAMGWQSQADVICKKVSARLGTGIQVMES